MPKKNPKKTIGKGQELNLTRTFDAPRDVVWKAWTDEGIVQKWWGPKFFTNPICEWNATEGGLINVLMTADEREELGPYKGMKSPMGGMFREVIPQERLVFTTTALGEGGAIMMQNLNTVMFEDGGDEGKMGSGKTKVSLHVIVESVTPAMLEALKGMSMGWSQSFDKLAEVLQEESRGNT